MKIRIVDFYPRENEKKDKLYGTIKIELEDLGITLSGILAGKKNNGWFFMLPYLNGIDHTTNEKVKYPFIIFHKKEVKAELMAWLKENGPAFVEKRSEEIFSRPEYKKDHLKKSEDSISSKVWKDPPPRKFRPRVKPKNR